MQAFRLYAKGRLLDLVDGRLSIYSKEEAYTVLSLAIIYVRWRIPTLKPSISEGLIDCMTKTLSKFLALPLALRDLERLICQLLA
ncbi:conserved hypothetical protein [Ricinus communis]|uniref:Uncharacterized protein n=1 Tax=Ricinus communis TaxID=3988 RepID=B9RTC3_RICCO|nr:conserved hypothetical protein [Ricinus communis]